MKDLKSTCYPKRVVILLSFCLVLLLSGSTYVIDPIKNVNSHNVKGLLHLKDGYYHAAVQEFKLAIALSPNSSATASFYNNLGIAYLKLTAYDLAIESFQRAISRNPNFLEYYQNLILTYKSKKVMYAAVKNYRKIITVDSSNSSSWLILGLLYKELNYIEQAKHCFNEYKKLEPDLILTRAVDDIIKKLD